MKKIFDKRVLQYTLQGELVNIFECVRDASNKFSNYTSIIRCCNKNSKSSGGYVWRFEGDEFSIIETDQTKNNSEKYICKICNSVENVRSMAMHLRYYHTGIKTKEYEEQYGPFRSNRIREKELKQDSNLICEICKEPLMHNRQLMYHISTHHKEITKNEYLIKYLYNGTPPVCKCGCGKETKIYDHLSPNKGLHHMEYIKGHWDWVKPGSHFHSEETKIQMRKSAIKRLENEKGLFKGVSKLEKELGEFIKNNYIGNIILGDNKVLSGLELDIFLPEINLAIEFNGIYYHSDLFKDKRYHLKKTKECNKQNIRLIYIWENDWKYKKDIIKSILLNILGGTKTKIYGRKCEVRTVNSKEKTIFLTENHLQGNCISKYNYGLYYNNELISVMIFGKLRKNLKQSHSEGKFELLRFCNKLDTTVIGGASKLFKHFIKEINPENIISYANRDWSNGNLYLNLGMKELKPTEIGYNYYKSNIKYNRFNFRKDLLVKEGFDPNKTEYEIMTERGFLRVWNTGNLKFEYQRI